MAKKRSTSNDRRDQSQVFSGFATVALMAAERLGAQEKSVGEFPLNESERALVADLPGVSVTLRKKLKSKTGTFTVAETARIVMAVAESLLDGDPLTLATITEKLPPIAEKLTDCLQASLVPAAPDKAKPKKPKPKPNETVYQFKITLLESEPPIWRRIQLRNCSLDKLHEHIQTAMGWSNSHLHQFNIEGETYGDPELLDDDFGDFECSDSTVIKLSQILPKTGQRLAFKYEYDFGDCWEHEILFEGRLTVDAKVKYPLCVEGERACPPEDCGGVGGYNELLKVIRNPRHKQYKDLREWIGGPFDSEKFDPGEASKEMKTGLPKWK